MKKLEEYVLQNNSKENISFTLQSILNNNNNNTLKSNKVKVLNNIKRLRASRTFKGSLNKSEKNEGAICCIFTAHKKMTNEWFIFFFPMKFVRKKISNEMIKQIRNILLLNGNHWSITFLAFLPSHLGRRGHGHSNWGEDSGLTVSFIPFP